mmetsp:Transcript_87369/g.199526  ORF Transcript_87369/g.199526 Transcript_87369/m.199526 type:complete len:445 (-) Transcript_87369:26-1360(-)
MYESHVVRFIASTVLLFLVVIGPTVVAEDLFNVALWFLSLGGSLYFWYRSCFADPGWLGPCTIEPQSDGYNRQSPELTFDSQQPVESQLQELVEKNRQVFATGRLEQLELEQMKLNFQRLLINEAKRKASERLPAQSAARLLPAASTGGAPDCELDAYGQVVEHLRQLERHSGDLLAKMKSTAESVANERRRELLSANKDDYVHFVDAASFKRVCVICRQLKTMRSHHCKDCGRCVDRLDHHCPWIDNCVGIGNQRPFFVFIVVLFLAVLQFYVCVGKYFMILIDSLGDDDSAMETLQDQIWSRFGLLCVVLASLFNLIWLGFLGALVARHSVYMMVNITTFEVLVRPPHVVRRFPREDSKFWFLADAHPTLICRSVWAFWSLSRIYDQDDFRAKPAWTRGSSHAFGPLLQEDENDDIEVDTEFASGGRGSYGTPVGIPPRDIQ